MTVGETIRHWRKERRLSQRGLAREAGLSYTYISQLEKGEVKSPTVHALQKIAQALKIPLNWFTAPFETESYCGETDPWVIKRLRSMHVDQLPTEAQESVIRFVKHVQMMVAEEQAEYHADGDDAADDAPDDRAIAG